MKKVAQRLVPLGYMALLATLLIGPLWRQPGMPNSADGLLHLHRSAAVARSLASGVYWPRWFSDVYAGLGAPTFHYYSPLFYLLTGSLHGAGLALDTAAKTVITIGFVVCGLGAIGWLRRLLGVNAALAGATLYLTQSLFFREYYFQGDYPQLLALYLLPLSLGAITALYQEDRARYWLAAPLCLALLVMTHNLTAMIGGALLSVYWLLLLLWKRDLAGGLRGVTAALLAALLSAVYWMPALGDVGFVQVQNLQQGFFRYGQYFLDGAELLAPPPLLDARAANPPFPHSLGWAAWLALLAGVTAALTALVRRRGHASGYWGAGGVGLALGSVFLTLPYSTSVWRTLPGLNLIQFPWRWLGPASVGAALAGAAGVALWPRSRRWPAAAGLILAAIAASAVFLFPAHPFLRFPHLSGADTRRYEERSHTWGMTSGNEFLPLWADVAVATKQQPPPAVSGVTWRWLTPHLGQARLAAPTAEAILLPVHYFPAWEARADGRVLSIEPSAAGWIRVQPETPISTVQLRWRGTDWQHRGQWLGIAGLILWLAVALGKARRHHHPERGTAGLPPAEPGTVALLGLLVALILLRPLAAGIDWFQRRSPPGAVLGVPNTANVPLGGEDQPSIRLIGWELLSEEHPTPGATVHVRLYWQPQRSTSTDLHSFLHLYSPERRHSWAIAQNLNPGRIPTSRWRTALYYVDDLRLPIPLDVAPATYTLAVGLVTPGGARLSVPGNDDGLVLLRTLTLNPLRAGWRQPLRATVAARATVGESLRLQGYDLLPAPGGPILRLFWTPHTTVAADYTVFIHLYDPGGRRIAQYDGPPLDGLLPTTEWPPGSLLIDRRQLWLPDDLPGGRYTFRVGLYDPADGIPLPITPDPDHAPHFRDDALEVPLWVPAP